MAPEKPDSHNEVNPTDGKDRTDPKHRLRPGGGYRRLRTARQGKNAGSRFWGCPGYPDCRGTRPLETGKKVRHRMDPTDDPKTGRKKP